MKKTNDSVNSQLSEKCTGAVTRVSSGREEGGRVHTLMFPTLVPACEKALPGQSEEVKCLFCEDDFLVNSNSAHSTDTLLRHLAEQHKFVIADVKLVADMKSYIGYWRKRLQEVPLSQCCTVIRTNTKNTDVAPSENFYLLCDALPEDKQLREQLQKKRLEDVLEQQQRERYNSSFNRTCLFCKQQFQGDRSLLFDHMTFDHNFNVGQPDNIVFSDELLDALEEKLKNLQCLYCEKVFKDWAVLKEHMRKKQHKKINPKNTLYDKFYIINYLEIGKNWEEVLSEDDYFPSQEEENEQEWDGWLEEGPGAVCLFCEFTTQDIQNLMTHMEVTHQFDYHHIKMTLQLTFYQQVKLVNYIRKKVHKTQCLFCEEQFTSQGELRHHLQETKHISQMPDARTWDQPQYYFPTYENDHLLYYLEDGDI